MNLQRTIAIAAALALPAGAAAAGDDGISEVYKRVKGSVVVVQTQQREVDPVARVNLVSVGGLGSGVLISEDGKVMTAAHVVQTADAITIKTISGESIPARVVASEPSADVALLQLQRLPTVAQVASLGDSDSVQVGDPVFVVGAPFGISHSLTAGHVSARREEHSMLGGVTRTELFQTDAAINQGNSGGPMFNHRGEVVGIVSYILSHGGGFEGLGFVVTSNTARRLLLEDPSLWSGLQGFVLEGDLARLFNVPQSTGLMVERVAADSPAGELGLRPGLVKLQVAGAELTAGGDVILEAFGISLADERAFEKIRKRMRNLEPGDEWALKVLRGGKIIELRERVTSTRQARPGAAR
jgi:S1-C subfamily serine protease